MPAKVRACRVVIDGMTHEIRPRIDQTGRATLYELKTACGIEYQEMTFYTRFQKIPQVDCMACIALAGRQG